MRITDLRTHVLFDGWRNLVFVELETDSGLTGIGEATLANRTEAVVAYLHGSASRHVTGADPFDVELLWRRLYLGDFIRGGMDACAGLSAIDIACHDLMGKALGVPAFRLLGGACRESVPCYANGWYTVARDPDAVAERAREVVARGYGALKLDPFGSGAGELTRRERALSVAIVRAVREAIGPDVEIYVEAHGRFVPAEAIRICRLLEPLEIGWMEEPCSWDDPLAWREVRERVGIPIAGGEHFCTRHGFRAVIENRCVDILQPDVLYCGGLSELRKLAAWADAYGLRVAPHNSQGPVCTAATVHAALGIPNLKVVEVFDDFVPPFVRQAVPGCPMVEGGRMALTEAPGLGVSLDGRVIAEHPGAPGHFDLWAEAWERRFRAPGAG